MLETQVSPPAQCYCKKIDPVHILQLTASCVAITFGSFWAAKTDILIQRNAFDCAGVQRSDQSNGVGGAVDQPSGDCQPHSGRHLPRVLAAGHTGSTGSLASHGTVRARAVRSLDFAGRVLGTLAQAPYRRRRRLLPRARAGIWHFLQQRGASSASLLPHAYMFCTLIGYLRLFLYCSSCSRTNLLGCLPCNRFFNAALVQYMASQGWQRTPLVSTDPRVLVGFTQAVTSGWESIDLAAVWDRLRWTVQRRWGVRRALYAL